MEHQPVTPIQRKGRTHTIVRTYLNKRGEFSTGVTGISGATDAEAMRHYRHNVKSARTNKNLYAVLLIAADDTVLAEWYRPVKNEAVA